MVCEEMVKVLHFIENFYKGGNYLLLDYSSKIVDFIRLGMMITRELGGEIHNGNC